MATPRKRSIQNRDVGQQMRHRGRDLDIAARLGVRGLCLLLDSIVERLRNVV
jgi:hypothetical protein